MKAGSLRSSLGALALLGCSGAMAAPYDEAVNGFLSQEANPMRRAWKIP